MLEVITGPVKSGKTFALLATIHGARRETPEGVCVFRCYTPEGSRAAGASHGSPCQVVSRSTAMDPAIGAALVSGHPVAWPRCNPVMVAVDECQFLEPEAALALVDMAARGAWVVVAGLSHDAAGDRFPTTTLLSDAADGGPVEVVARCWRCGEIARHSQAMGERVRVADEALRYEPACDHCWRPVRVGPAQG